MTIQESIFKTYWKIYYRIACFLVTSILLLSSSQGKNLTFLYQTKDNSLVDLQSEYSKLTKKEVDERVKKLTKDTITLQNNNIWNTLLQFVENLNIPDIKTPLDLDLKLVRRPGFNDSQSLHKLVYFFRSIAPGSKVQESDQYIIEKNNQILVSKKEAPLNESIKVKFTRVGKTLFEDDNLSVYKTTTIDELWAYVVNQVKTPNTPKEPLVTIHYRNQESNELKKLSSADSNSRYISTETIEKLKASEVIFSRPKKKCFFYITYDQSLISAEEIQKVGQKQFSSTGNFDINDDFKSIEVEIVQGEKIWQTFNKVASQIQKSPVSIDVASFSNMILGKESINTTKYRVNHFTHFMLMERQALGKTIKCTLKKEGDNSVVKELEVAIYKDNTYKEIYYYMLHEAGYQVNEHAESGFIKYEKIKNHKELAFVKSDNQTELIEEKVGKDEYSIYGISEYTRYDIKNAECTFTMPASAQLIPAVIDITPPDQQPQNHDDIYSLSKHFKKWWPYYITIGLVLLSTGLVTYIVWSKSKENRKKVDISQLTIPNIVS